MGGASVEREDSYGKGKRYGGGQTGLIDGDEGLDSGSNTLLISRVYALTEVAVGNVMTGLGCQLRELKGSQKGPKLIYIQYIHKQFLVTAKQCGRVAAADFTGFWVLVLSALTM